MNIRQMPSPNQRERYCKKTKKTFSPQIIVCHIMEGYYESGIGWLRNPASSASAHFVVSKKGEISQLVDILNMAWTQGVGVNPTNVIAKSKMPADPNAYCISIENEGFYYENKGALTEAQLAANIWLIGYIISEVKRRFNVIIPADREHIIGHYELCPLRKPNCPGQNFQWDKIINALNPAPVTAPTPSQTIYTVQNGDSLYKIAQKKEIYGNGNLYMKIYNANKSVIGNNPNNIKAGMKLVIPK